jgi:uncharacterized membrane protein
VRPRPLPTALENIETIARFEEECLNERSTLERIADAIGAFVGTIAFVLLHVAWFTSWILINTGLVPGVRAFDPFPFLFLGMAVSLEGVLLTTFVLMKQNRMSRRSETRNQLNLQIDLLAEREATKMLQMLRAICDHIGLESEAHQPEVKQLAQDTAVDVLAQELKKKMPDQ